MALRKYRKVYRRSDLNGHYGTDRGMQERCAELALLTEITNSSLFDSARGKTLFPLSNASKEKGAGFAIISMVAIHLKCSERSIEKS